MQALVCGDMPRPRLRNGTDRQRLFTRPPLDRMHRIFHAIKAGAFPNRTGLAGEIEVTTKTIQRDIDFMRDRLHLPIAYNGDRKGYEFTEGVEHFPMVELTEAELVSVFVAQKALTQYIGTPFEHPLRSAFEKLVSGLKGKITLSWDDLHSFISFRSFEIVPTDLTTFQVVSEAVRKGSVLEFEYKKLNSSSYEKRTIEPYHLACIQNQWYCFGHDINRREMRTFVLARMRAAVGTGQTFLKSKKFSLKDHLKDSLGVFSGKGTHDIRIRFDKFAAQLVRERVWHPSQQIQELTGGGIELRITLSTLHEIEPWILSWGAHAKVLGPKELITRIKQVTQDCSYLYRQRLT
jgi:predicted DNA-binding transcriptional regulator YafY